jgi:peptidoglycan-associated lipoprotein
MLKKLLLLVVTGFFLASCAATNTNQGGDSDASASSSGSDGSIVAGTQEDLIVNVGDRVFFEFDSSELTVDAQATLDAQVAWLMQYPDTNITIEGHADERGTREYNLALGDKRAFAVYSYLAQAGIDTNRMEYISWGKERPEVVGSDETAYSQNRRGVTTVTN